MTRFAITRPCPKRWTDLDGAGRLRHCDVCRTDVHAIEQYSPEEWDKLWRNSHGHICAFLGGESPAEPRSRRTILVGALLTAISPLMAETGRLRIRVTEATGAVLATAEASVLGPDGKPLRRVRANDAGEIALSDLPLGNCRLAVIAPGFKQRPLTVVLRNGGEVRVDTVLEVGSVGELWEVEPASAPASDTLPQPPEPRPAPPAAASPMPEPRPRKRRRWWILR